MADCRKPRPMSERFKKAVEIIRSLPKEGSFQPSNTVKLKFYALYKQVMEGPCNKPKPAFWDAVGRAKWEAWSMCRTMSKDQATQMYVEEMQQLVDAMPPSSQVQQLLASIGPYYEGVSHCEEDATDHDDLDLSQTAVVVPEEVDVGEIDGVDNGGGDGGGGGIQEEREEVDGMEVQMSQSDSDGSDIFQESYQQFYSSHHSDPLRPSGELHTTEQSSSLIVPRGYHTPRDSHTPTSQHDSHSGIASQIQSQRHTANFTLDGEALNHVISQIQAVQSSLQSVLHQLTTLASSSNAGQTLRTRPSNQVPFWRSSLFFRLVPFLLSWPFILRFILTLHSKRFGGSPSSSTAGGMWLVTFLNTACSVALVVFVAHQPRTET